MDFPYYENERNPEIDRLGLVGRIRANLGFDQGRAAASVDDVEALIVARHRARVDVKFDGETFSGY